MDPKKITEASSAAGEAVTAAARLAAVPTVAREESGPAPSYDWLGPSLRRMYDDVLNEAIPDSFVDLLKQLYDREKKR